MPLNLETLEAWRKAASDLSALKEREMALRKAVFASAFENAKEGTNVCDIQDGWALKATLPYTRTLEQAKAEQALKDLKKNKMGYLLKIKYELSVSDYKKLEHDDVAKAIIDSILTTKPGAPSLELVPPKAA